MQNMNIFIFNFNNLSFLWRYGIFVYNYFIIIADFQEVEVLEGVWEEDDKKQFRIQIKAKRKKVNQVLKWLK